MNETKAKKIIKRAGLYWNVLFKSAKYYKRIDQKGRVFYFDTDIYNHIICKLRDVSRIGNGGFLAKNAGLGKKCLTSVFDALEKMESKRLCLEKQLKANDFTQNFIKERLADILLDLSHTEPIYFVSKHRIYKIEDEDFNHLSIMSNDSLHGLNKMCKQNFVGDGFKCQVLLHVYRNEVGPSEYTIGILLLDPNMDNSRKWKTFIYAFRDTDKTDWDEKFYLSPDAVKIVPKDGFSFMDIENYVREHCNELPDTFQLQNVLNELYYRVLDKKSDTP